MDCTRLNYRVEPVEWDSPDADDARRIRVVVFVDEQKVPLEEEIDEIDPAAFHVIAYNSAGEACGTARLFADPDEPGYARIGRMAVLLSHRGSGCGSALLSSLLQTAKQQGYRQAVLSAQQHAISFYERNGFAAAGGFFEEAGISHMKMVRKL